MTDDPLDEASARKIAQNLLKRLIPDAHGNFSFHGSLTDSDAAALRLLAGAVPVVAAVANDENTKKTRRRFGEPAAIDGSAKLNLDCLDVPGSEDGDVAAIDFGTAYSKAALWKDGAKNPISLDLAAQVSERSGNLLESSVYITEGVLHFGPQANAIFQTENDPRRELLDSPKQELSILTGGRLLQIADPRVDPTGSLTHRDLLVLYLGYLSAATSAALEAVGADRYTARRFAVPVWEAGKLTAVARLLKRLLVDAQILADTLTMEVWTSGLAVTDAVHILKVLQEKIADPKRDGAGFIGKHVVEANAAAAAIGEKLSNKRPVVLVMDVGAGTTDVGLYQFVLPKGGLWRVAPIGGGQGAFKLAGNELDETLKQFIQAQAHIDSASQDGKRKLWGVSKAIRQHKATLFTTGHVDIDEIDDQRFQRDDFLNSAQVAAFKKSFREKLHKQFESLTRAGLERPDGHFAVVTGGGALVPIFAEVFAEPVKLSDGEISFTPQTVEPAWLDDQSPDTLTVFPQLAVSVGACSPFLPEEVRPVTDVSVAPKRVIGPMYRS